LKKKTMGLFMPSDLSEQGFLRHGITKMVNTLIGHARIPIEYHARGGKEGVRRGIVLSGENEPYTDSLNFVSHDTITGEAVELFRIVLSFHLFFKVIDVENVPGREFISEISNKLEELHGALESALKSNGAF
jgi:hypothetical protein